MWLIGWEEKIVETLQLTRDVWIEGRNFFGRNAWVRFMPASGDGWFWKPARDVDPILITPDILQYRRRRARFYSGTYSLEHPEHLGLALRWLGLDRVIIEGNGWPPYFGRVWEVWERLEPFCKPLGVRRKIPWVTVGKNKLARGEYPRDPNRYTEIRFSSKRALNIIIRSSYPGLPRGYMEWSIPTKRDMPLSELLQYYTQGWPPWLYVVSRAASALGWPHHRRIIWPREWTPDSTITNFMRHRLTDLLSILATLDPNALLAAHVISNNSGHYADLEAVKQARENLVHIGGKYVQ